MTKEESSGLQDIFLKQRTVLLSGEINSETSGEVARRLLVLQKESLEAVNLIIDSGGGEINSALKLCDFMSGVLSIPIRGIAMGKCMSAATFIMLHCDQRLSTPFARFMIHSGTIGGISVQINDSTSKNLEALLEQTNASERQVTALYMSKLKKSKEEVELLYKRGNQRFNDTMSAEEALEIGLIERIVEGKLGIFPEPSQG